MPTLRVSPFQALGQLQQIAYLFFRLGALIQLRFLRTRFFQRHAELKGHQLRQLIDKVIGQVQYPPNISHHRFCRHGAERGDLGNTLGTILLFYIVNDVFTAVLAKIDIEVRHGNPLRIKEALKQQIVTKRIEVRNTQRISDQRARAGASAWSYRYAIVLRPVDEIGNDQKVTGKPHLYDGGSLEIQPSAIFWHLRITLEPYRERAFSCVLPDPPLPERADTAPGL